VHFDFAAGKADVDLGADAEAAGKIDSRFDRKARIRKVTSRVVRLEVVVVDAVAVRAQADVVAGAVDEALAVAGLRDYAARSGIHFRAGGQLRRLHQLQRGIARLED